MSSSFKAHDEHSTVNLLGCINNCQCGESEPEICSSAPSVPNRACWFKGRALAMHPLLFFRRNHRVHVHVYTVVPALRCCNSPRKGSGKLSLLTFLLSAPTSSAARTTARCPPGQAALLGHAIHFGTPRSTPPRAPKGRKSNIHLHLHQVQYFDTNKSMLSSSFPLLCKVRLLRVSLGFNYNWNNLISNTCISHLTSAPKAKEKAIFLIL